MVQFSAMVASLLFAGVLAALWQLPPQGAQGRRAPIAVLGLICLSYLLITPTSEALLAAVCVNSAYLLSHLSVLSALALSTLYWAHYLAADPPPRRRALATRVAYGAVVVALVGLFAAAPQQPHGVGYGREFDDSPHMRIYWVLQAAMVIHAVFPLARAAARAYRQEPSWRRVLLGVLAGMTVVFVVYELWVIVVVLVWPAMPPPWAQIVTTVLQVAVGVLLVAGTFGPVVSGAFHSTRVALSYLEQLAPLHHWLMQRYPHIRFRTRPSLRAETRVTEMLIEISDGLRLLQRDEPVVAAFHGLDHDTIRAVEYDRTHHAAYELAAAVLFRSRTVTAEVRADPEGRLAGPPAHAGT
ncbi:hypothetical protein H0264_22030 [Nocardia huaxiensis]|uniref:DUF6545 domain-containing protein n=1 Tax=Nocardia huaxiensis TaxID=2755382 RepID=A0A7D6Z957_9NOCA|nr:DUF6545 domain-containing protein [Nocardia huaxiensis]QLY28078.1 hypothetical protein H0264_22030 [Nocardia huaxiensis]